MIQLPGRRPLPDEGFVWWHWIHDHQTGTTIKISPAGVGTAWVEVYSQHLRPRGRFKRL